MVGGRSSRGNVFRGCLDVLHMKCAHTLQVISDLGFNEPKVKSV